MHGHDVIVLGASTGGVEALSRVAADLPPGLPAAVFVVCHIPADSTSMLPAILGRSGPLPAGHAADGEEVRPGHVYVAPPDYHLLLEPGGVRLSHAARENLHRPAIDPLFRSAARAYGPRVVGVILTGALSDGVAGLIAVRAAGGVGVVQDPLDAFMPSMPRNAWQLAGADHVLPLARIAPLLVRLAHEPLPVDRGSPMSDPIDQMPQRVDEDMAAQEQGGRPGAQSVYTCPECGGSLWQVDAGDPTRFRCHVGHSYYGESLLQEQSEILEPALWTAVRGFREKAVLARQLARLPRQQGNARAAERFEDEAARCGSYSRLIREKLLRVDPGREPPPAPPEPGAVGREPAAEE
jgi:two-component system chemotaxis response regulator CheB